MKCSDKMEVERKCYETSTRSNHICFSSHATKTRPTPDRVRSTSLNMVGQVKHRMSIAWKG